PEMQVPVVPGGASDWKVRVAILDASASLAQQLDDLVRRRLAIVVDVRLVRETEDAHARAFQRFSLLVQRQHDLVDDVCWHAVVDLAGELDEARPGAVFRGLPGQVEGVEWDAVAAQTGPRIEGHEAERLRLSG